MAHGLTLIVAGCGVAAPTPIAVEEPGASDSFGDTASTTESFSDGTQQSATCVPRTCEDVGAECGPLDDGCGHRLSCGTCGPGEICRSHACGCPNPGRCPISGG